jgi:hypothetical protein
MDKDFNVLASFWLKLGTNTLIVRKVYPINLCLHKSTFKNSFFTPTFPINLLGRKMKKRHFTNNIWKISGFEKDSFSKCKQVKFGFKIKL